MTTVTLGDWIQAVYQTFLDEFGDEELAELATSALIYEEMEQGTLFPSGLGLAA
jgi:hypothetical protein